MLRNPLAIAHKTKLTQETPHCRADRVAYQRAVVRPLREKFDHIEDLFLLVQLSREH